MKKFLAIMSVFAITCLCTTSINAAGSIDASLVLTATSSTAIIFENSTPPNTSKELTGTYMSEDARGKKIEKHYSRYIAVGQLNVKVYADEHFKSVHSYYRYYLEGALQPKTVIRYWG